MVEVTFVSFIAFWVGVGSSVNLFYSAYQSISKTDWKPAYTCLSGLVPIVMFYCSMIVLFTQTEWAKQNPALACILCIPLYSLMTARQIVCNVTKMHLDPICKSSFWFLLFPLNRYAASIFRKFYSCCLLLIALLTEHQSATDSKGHRMMFSEETVALTVLLINLLWYSIFVVGTIQQICSNLDIYCLSIKQKISEKQN